MKQFLDDKAYRPGFEDLQARLIHVEPLKGSGSWSSASSSPARTQVSSRDLGRP